LSVFLTSWCTVGLLDKLISLPLLRRLAEEEFNETVDFLIVFVTSHNVSRIPLISIKSNWLSVIGNQSPVAINHKPEKSLSTGNDSK